MVGGERKGGKHKRDRERNSIFWLGQEKTAQGESSANMKRRGCKGAGESADLEQQQRRLIETGLTLTANLISSTKSQTNPFQISLITIY